MKRKFLILFTVAVSFVLFGSNLMKAEDEITKGGKIFIVNNDGTVTDLRSSLMWVKKPLTSEYDWINAISYVKSLNKANNNKGTYGYKDWRLPRIDELKSLVKESGSSPDAWLNSNGFENIQPGGYWSSTTYNADTPSAWSIDLSNGMDYGCSMSMNYMVLPVRKIKK